MRKLVINDRQGLDNDSDQSFDVFRSVIDSNTVILELTNVVCNYDTDTFASRYLRGNGRPITFGVPLSALDRSLEIAVATMNDLEVAQIEINLLGKNLSTEMPDNTLVQFECEAKLRITDDRTEVHEWSDSDKWDFALLLKLAAVDLITGGGKTYSSRLSAFILFTKALKFLSFVPEASLSAHARALEIQCLLNLVFLHLCFANYAKVVPLATLVLSKDQHNEKAFYRRGVAYLHLQDYELARKDLEMVLKNNPRDKLVIRHLRDLQSKQKELDNKYSIAMKKMFSL